MGHGGAGVFHDPHRALHDREFPVAETHGIPDWPGNRLLIDSRGRGWRDVYTSYTAEAPWEATLPGLPHPCIAYCSNGSATIHRHIDGEPAERAELSPRHFGMVPETRSSSWQLDGTPDIQLVYVRRQLVDELAAAEFDAEPGEVDFDHRVGFSDPMLESLVTALLGELRDDNLSASSNGLYADHLVRLIALRVLHTRSSLRTARVATASDATTARLQAVRELIESSLAEDLSLRRLAAASGLRAHTLAKAFTREFGIALHTYVISRRVERAKTLLRNHDLSLAEVAFATGFASQSHLTTAFKRHVHVTPGRYRASGP